jgi:hypothetical protein
MTDGEPKRPSGETQPQKYGPSNPPPDKQPPEWLWCTRHNTWHPRDKFYDNPRGKYGKTTWCKQGMKSRNKRLRYQQNRYTSPETLARRDVTNALKRGHMIKPEKCADWGKPVGGVPLHCDGQRLEFHHTHGYAPEHWRTGVWVCHLHHNVREGKSE